METLRSHKIAVVGSGYVGTVTAACFAWLGHSVVGLEHDEHKSKLLQQGHAPFYEPGIPELLREATQSGRLQFTSDDRTALHDAGVVFLCVGTPLRGDGLPDLTQIESAAAALAAHAPDEVVIVNKSTVPVGSGNWIRSLLEEALPIDSGRSFSVVSNPEFLREGSAIDDFFHPDRIVLGGDDAAIEIVAGLYERVLKQTFDGGNADRAPELIITDLPSAELIKYAANAFLATKISFANEISALSELVGADAGQVLPAIGADERIGRQFLDPGIGWGGSCFGKDIATLVATGEEQGYDAKLLRATVSVNCAQRDAVLRKLQFSLKVLKGRRIALLGLAFKPGTDDVRDAPALDIAARLLNLGALVSAFDPVVSTLPEEFDRIRLAADPYTAAQRADALVLATEWDDFRSLDYERLAKVMRGSLLLDGRNALDSASASAAGLVVVGIGR